MNDHTIILPEKLTDHHKELIEFMLNSGMNYVFSRGCERHSMQDEDVYTCLALIERIKNKIGEL